jgi:peptidoglycan/LPS O-acetylase OafA/YrhL
MRWNTSAMPEAEWNWQRITVINRFDALMVGVIAAWLSLRFPAVWQRSAWAAALAGVVLVFGTYVTLWRVEGNWVTNAHDSIYARVWRFNLVSLGFALLLPLASGWKVAAENFASMAVRRIALWSYAIYLVQHPVSRWIMPRFFPDWQRSASSAWCLFSLLLLVTVAVSALLHHAFEAPCTRLRERAGPVIRRFFAAA